MRRIGVGLIGMGTVGYGVARVIHLHKELYKKRYDIDLEIVAASARSPKDLASVGIAEENFTTDWTEVIANPEVDIVVELIGGTTVAHDIVKAALEAGKSVVTANKALMASTGNELLKLAEKNGAEVRCEASVGGGIPILAPLQDSLHANQVVTIAGIVNGTTNYILTTMEEEELSFEQVLKDAQEKGYAELDPTADVDGFDAAAKIAILASLGFDSHVSLDDVYTAGIRDVSLTDIEYASDLGYKIKLLAIARLTKTGVDVRVHPTMIPSSHQLAGVSGVFNAIYVIGDVVGETMFFGQGAGQLPTASAVVSDILTAAKREDGERANLMVARERTIPVRDIQDIHTKYYIRLKAVDKPGVLAATADCFGRHDVSIESMVQKSATGTNAELVYITHRAAERNLRKALEEIESLEIVAEVSTLIRVEDTETWKFGVLS